MSPILLAIDPGTTTGLAWKRLGYPNETMETALVKVPKTGDRCQDLSTYSTDLRVFISTAQPGIVLIENYSFASRGNAVTHQAEIGGIIRAQVGRLHLPWVEVAIPTWKSITFRAKKDTKAQRNDYLSQAFNVLGVHVHNCDIADAALMLHTVDVAMSWDRKSPGLTALRASVQKALDQITAEG
jgi:Holliday junction resolvasome RuvABC endonuclease subunit